MDEAHRGIPDDGVWIKNTEPPCGRQSGLIRSRPSCKTEGRAAAYSPHLELSTDSIPDLNWGADCTICCKATLACSKVTHASWLQRWWRLAPRHRLLSRQAFWRCCHLSTYTHIHIYTYTHIQICLPYGWLARTFRWTVPRQPSSIQRSSAMSLWLCQLQFCDSRTTRSTQTWHLERIMTIGRSPSSSSLTVCSEVSCTRRRLSPCMSSSMWIPTELWDCS